MKYCTDGGERNKIATGKMDFVVTGWQKNLYLNMAKVNKEEAVQWYAQNRGLYKKLSEKLHSIITEVLEESNITVHAITSRTKDIDSFKNKITNDKYDDPLNQITDFSGVRVIAYVENDLKPICKIIEDSFEIDLKNSSNKSDELGIDKVGYKSIHYIAKIKQDRLILPEYKKFKNLRFEFQIRTILQHAWAEIEHDRNYKFNGVLDPEIARRFKLIAGTLELVDREFNQLAKDIDKISENVIIADQQNGLGSISLNSTTLKEFLSTRFINQIQQGRIVPQLFSDKTIISELKLFGIKTLHDLDKIVTNDFIENYTKALAKIKNQATYVGVLRDIMICNDYKKYFEKSWNKHWSALDEDTITIFEEFNINPIEIKTNYLDTADTED